MNKEKQIIKEFETNYTCEWRWKREAHLKPSAGDFLLQALKSQKKDIVEKIEKILTRHSNWKPTCGYESEEEKGYQEGLQAEAGLIEKEIKEELNLITKEK